MILLRALTFWSVESILLTIAVQGNISHSRISKLAIQINSMMCLESYLANCVHTHHKDTQNKGAMSHTKA